MYATRLLVKPGITGPWQVSGRNDLSEEESQQLDVSYVQNWPVLGGHCVHSPYYRHGSVPQWCILEFLVAVFLITCLQLIYKGDE